MAEIPWMASVLHSRTLLLIQQAALKRFNRRLATLTRQRNIIAAAQSPFGRRQKLVRLLEASPVLATKLKHSFSVILLAETELAC